MNNKIARNVFTSLASSAVIVWLMARLVGSGGLSAGDVMRAVKNAELSMVAVYFACQFAQTVFRAWRARALLAASLKGSVRRAPGLGHVALVTFVRGACADMLPARIGELSYVAMLNKGCAIPAADCFSSLAIGLLFDFAALLFVLLAAVATVLNGARLLGSALMLAAVCVVGAVGICFVLPWFAGLLERRAAARALPKPLARCVELVCGVAESVGKTRRDGVFLKVFTISALIRAAKYAGLYFLFIGVTRNLWPELANAGVAATLVALISAEGAASLPVPSFMSFGSYEAGGTAALASMNFDAATAATAMLAAHIVSQMIDYGMGGIAFMIFMWLPKKDALALGATATMATPTPTTTPAPARPCARPSRRAVAALVAAAVALALAALACAAALQWRAAKKRGSAAPPEIGADAAMGVADIAALENLSHDFRGKIFWSSNRRMGRHDIWMLEFPGGKAELLTDSEFTDTFPRVSPDGKTLAFSRSRQPWVSQRNPLEWDAWTLDLETRRETLITTNAYMAVWVDNGASLLFSPDGGATIVKQKAEPGAPREILIEAGKGRIPAGVSMTLPVARDNGDPWLAVTMRGARRNVAVVRRDGSWSKVGNDGCQGAWQGRDSAAALAWVDKPGRLKNAIWSEGSGGEARVLLDVPGDFSHEYFPQFSPSGKWLVFGASTGGHEQDSEDYEIFLWRVGASPDSAARLTFHTGNDCWPDIWEDAHEAPREDAQEDAREGAREDTAP